jgi:competence protein ComEA
MTMEERAQRTRTGDATPQPANQQPSNLLAPLDRAARAGGAASGHMPGEPSTTEAHLSDTSRADFHEGYWDDVPDDPHDDSAPLEDSRAATSAVQLLLGTAILYGVFALGGWVAQHSTKPPLVGPITPTVSLTAPAIVVHVAGRVHKPGVYTLPPNARVRDAVLKAGGPLYDADINAINLAAWAEDGTRIEVPAKPQPKEPQSEGPPPLPAMQSPQPTFDAASASATENSVEERALESPAPPAVEPETRATRVHRNGEPTARRARAATPRATARSAGAKVAGVPRATTASGQESVNASPEYLAKHPLDLNRARAEQLEMLPGIGPSLAGKIVAYREQNGGFKSVDDLDNVSGIGPKKLETLRPLVTVQ